VRRGGDWDGWDLEVVCGALGAARLVVAVEDHGAGNQLVRARWWPSVSVIALALIVCFAALSLAAELDGGWPVGSILGGAALGLALRTGCQCGAAAAAIDRTIREQG
jgi:H+/Cl- antiporter ClcA